MSPEVKEAMLTFLDLFKCKGVACCTRENIMQISEELLGVCKQLDAVYGLQDEHVADILTGLLIYGNSCI